MVNIIRRRDQIDPSTAMLPVMNRLMGQILGDPYLGEIPPGLATLDEGTLPLDISEDDNCVIVRASVPGFSPDEVDVDVENGIVTIKADHQEEREETGERFYRRERIWGSVSRRVALPSNVKTDAIEADLNNGVLTLRIPKPEQAKPKKVQIRQGQSGGQSQPRMSTGVPGQPMGGQTNRGQGINPGQQPGRPGQGRQG